MLLPSWLSFPRPTSRPSPTNRRQARRRPATRLQVEPLEDRCLLAADLGATLVADIVPGADSSNAQHLTNVNGTLFFGAVEPTLQRAELWTSDGTAAGTKLVNAFDTLAGYSYTQYPPRDFTPLNGSVFFTVSGGLWKTEGTTVGTVPLGVSAANLTPVNGKLFFAGYDGKNGEELWVSDATAAGTVLVKNIYPGSTTTNSPDRACGCRVTDKVPNSSSPRGLTDLNGTLLFSADDGKNGRELWRSDGTANGTKLVKDIAPGKDSGAGSSLTSLNGLVYFRGLGGLWKSDGTAAGTALVKNVNVITALTNVNGALFFAGNDGTSGSELWKSDGTPAGTVLVKDINPGSTSSYPSNLTNVNGLLYFVADDGTNGREVWKSDGTAAGTVLVKDTNPGSTSSYPSNLTNVNGRLYFAADDGASGRELWQSDGTAVGTVMVRDIYEGSTGSDPGFLTAMNNKLYFAATDPTHGRELWDPPAVGDSGYLLVGDWDEHTVLRYAEATGAFVDTFVPKHSGGLNQPFGLVFGPHDHNLYVSSGQFKGPGQLKAVLRYDGTTGAFIDEFVDSTHLTSPRGIIFGPDGNLYVADGDGNADGRIVRYDGKSGAFLGDFVPIAGNGGLSHPLGLVFGPDGKNPGQLDLYVTGGFTDSVLRYDGTSGVFLGEFVASGSGGLDHPQGLTFGPDGTLYVANAAFAGNPNVLRFQGPSGRTPGAFLGTFVTVGSGGLFTPFGLVFGPDGNNDGAQDLYVANGDLTGLKARNGTVKRYDGVTGAFIDTYVTAKSGGLDDPNFLTFTQTDPVTLAYTGGTLAAAATAPDPVNETLGTDQVQPLLTEAVARWQQAGADISGLTSIEVRIADLSGAMLGQTVRNTIFIDINAAGWGWFVDPTPCDDSEFTTPGNQGEQKRMDLLSVLAHEIGHLLDQEHAVDGVMIDTLATGIRRVPGGESDWLAAVDLLFSEVSFRKRR